MDDPLSMCHPRLCDVEKVWRLPSKKVMRSFELAKQTAAALVSEKRKKQAAPPIALSGTDKKRSSRGTRSDRLVFMIRQDAPTYDAAAEGAAQADRCPRLRESNHV